MVELNHRDRTIKVKLVYYGPPVGGKTTNLQILHRCADAKRRGELISINSAQDRTILFDLLPLKTPGLPRLRPAPAGPRGARPGHVLGHPPPGAEGRRLARLRRELRPRPLGGEHPELPGDDAEPPLPPPRPDVDAPRLPVQQARPAAGARRSRRSTARSTARQAEVDPGGGGAGRGRPRDLRRHPRPHGPGPGRAATRSST